MKKKFTFLFMLLSVVFVANAQMEAVKLSLPLRSSEEEFSSMEANYKTEPLFSEYFIQGRPSNWTVIDANKDGITWDFLSKAQVSEIISGFPYGMATLLGSTKKAEDWLITPRIAVPAGVDSVLFTSLVIVLSDEILEMALSFTDAKQTSFTESAGQMILKNTESGGTFWNVSLKLNKGYGGKNLYLAFINRSTNAQLMLLSEVTSKIKTRIWGNGVDDIATVNVPVVYIQDKTVCFENIYEKYEAEIYDITGKLHYKIPVASGTSQYLTKSGIYIVKLKSNSQSFNYKLMIQ